MPKQVICQYSQGKGNAGPSRRPLRLKPAQISLLATRATARDSRNSLIERDEVVLVLELVKEVQVHGLVDRDRLCWRTQDGRPRKRVTRRKESCGGIRR